MTTGQGRNPYPDTNKIWGIYIAVAITNGMSIKSNKSVIQRLYDSKSLDERFSVLTDEIIEAGFDAVLYTFIPKLSHLTKSIQPVFQYSEAFSDLVKYYQKYDLGKHDFTIRLVAEGKLSIIDWDETKKIAPSENELNVIRIIRDKFLVTKGITFPTLSSDMGIAGVSIISFNKDYTKKIIDPKLLDHIKTCSKMYHDHTMIHQDARYEFILPILKSLTTKKKYVLKHLISGQPMKSITEETDITVRYAEKLLVELRKDFGNISKNELIYFLGLLNISEYL